MAARGFPAIGSNPPLALLSHKDQREFDLVGLARDVRTCGDVHRLARRGLRVDVLLSRAAARVGQASPSHAPRPQALVLGSRGALTRSRSPARRLARCASVHRSRDRLQHDLRRRRARRAGARAASRLVAAHDRARLAHAGVGRPPRTRLPSRAARRPRRSSPEPRDRVRRHLPLLRRSGARVHRGSAAASIRSAAPPPSGVPRSRAAAKRPSR